MADAGSGANANPLPSSRLGLKSVSRLSMIQLLMLLFAFLSVYIRFSVQGNGHMRPVRSTGRLSNLAMGC